MSLSRLLAAPFFNPGMVARKEHVGYAEPAVLGRSGELRPAGCARGKAVLRQRARIADHARHQPRHRVDQYHRGDLATAENVIADRDLAARQGGAHTIVDALVPAADHDQFWLCRKLFGKSLVETFFLRLYQHHRSRVLRAD